MTITETPTATAVLTGQTAATVGRILNHAGSVASKDLARGYLCGIKVSTAVDPVSGADMLTFTATDSYRLIHCELPLADGDTAYGCDIVMNAKQAKQAAKLITRKNVDSGVAFTVTGPTCTVTTADGSANVELHAGTFPDVDRLLTPESTGELPRIDADLLSGLLSAMSGVITVNRDVAAHVDIVSVGGNKYAMKLTAAIPDVVRVTGVIMPIRR